MSDTPRCTFLRQLCGLPLVGGSISLIGSPKAVAEPITFHLLEAYKTWLHYEQRFLCWEMAKSDDFVSTYYPSLAEKDHINRANEIGRQFTYIGDAGNHRVGGINPSERAALVLSAVGCDWKDEDAETFGIANRIVRL
jgi:hypothetical protein